MIAITRAIYKDVLIVIRDEPMATLDPVAEYEVYSHFNDLVGGKTVIYISHRLSSFKFSDKKRVYPKSFNDLRYTLHFLLASKVEEITKRIK